MNESEPGDSRPRTPDDFDEDRSFYCLGCGYNLRGAAESRCPECGRDFDRDDASTFLPRPYAVGRYAWAAIVTAVVATGAVVASLTIDRDISVPLLDVTLLDDVAPTLTGVGVLVEIALFFRVRRLLKLPPNCVTDRRALLSAAVVSGLAGPGVLLAMFSIVAVRRLMELSV